MITHGELFAGIGGFGCGFGRVGIETKWHVEIDKQCQSILIRHWIETQIESNVCLVGKHNLCLVDIISFGSPCQDLSIAGLRKGFQDGTRSNLFFEAVRIIREIEPRYAIWENVPGALSSHGGRDFQSVLESLLETSVPMPKSGRWATAGMVRTGQKEIAWRVLDAQYFRVPQRRRRIFLIFCPRGDSAAEVLFEREGGAGDNPPSREARKADPETFVINLANGGANQNNVKETKTSDTLDTWMSQAVAFGWNKSSSQTMKIAETTDALQASPTSNPAVWHNYQKDGSIRMQEDGTAPTVSRQWGTGGNNVLFVGVRRLMPIECERLQGFPDGWTDGQSDSTRYKQLGNAVAVPVIEWIGKRIMAATCPTQHGPDGGKSGQN